MSGILEQRLRHSRKSKRKKPKGQQHKPKGQQQKPKGEHQAAKNLSPNLKIFSRVWCLDFLKPILDSFSYGVSVFSVSCFLCVTLFLSVGFKLKCFFFEEKIKKITTRQLDFCFTRDRIISKKGVTRIHNPIIKCSCFKTKASPGQELP